MVIFAYGTLLRFWALSYDLPHAFNPDEAYIMDRAVGVADGNLRHGVIFRGSLPYYITGFTIRIASDFYPKIKQGYPTFQEAYTRDKTPFFIIGRAIVATYSVLTMIILYLFARALLGETIGLLSVIVLSMNLLEIQFSHEIYPDSALSFTMLSTLSLLYIAYKRKQSALFFVAAILIGLSTAQKLPGIVLLPFCILIYRRVLVSRHVPLATQIVRYTLLVGIVIITYILSYPFVFSELSTFGYKWNEDTRSNFSQLSILEVSFSEKIRDYITWLRDSTGSLVFLMSLVGAIHALRMNVYFTKLLLGFIVYFILFISLTKAHWDNYLFPILPLVSLFAAIGLHTAYKAFFSLIHTKYVSLLSIGLLLLPATVKSLWLAQSFAVPDTRTQEVQWFKKQRLEGVRVARDGYTSIPIPDDRVLVSKLTSDQLKNFDYFVLSSSYSPSFSHPRRNTTQLVKYYDEIMASYTKIVEFTPHEIILYRDDIRLLKQWDWLNQPPSLRGPKISIYSTQPKEK